VAILSSRADRLTTLVEIAKPLADRARQQLGYAHDALEYGVTSSTEPGRAQLQYVLVPRPRRLRHRQGTRPRPQQ